MRLVLSALLLALVATGAIAQEDPGELDGLLAASFGAHDVGREPPAFGDALLMTPEFQVEDPPVADRAVPFRTRRGAPRVVISVVWGYLAPHHGPDEPIDWSGSIRVTNAAVRVLRTLAIEETTAVVVRPRTDVHVVEFESHTRPQADGLLLEVILAPALNPGGDPVSLTFDTAPYSETIPISAGMRLSLIRPVDDAGHVVAYQVIRPDTGGCAEGIFRGRWETTQTGDGREVGRLRARFAADEGRLRGHLRGVLGERQNGKQVWFAKMVDRGGAFLGLLAGRYGDGQFAGLLLGRGHEVRGVVRGRYFEGIQGQQGGFVARYSERCGEDPREGQVLEDDEPDISLDDP
jgi:hypothetical protein